MTFRGGISIHSYEYGSTVNLCCIRFITCQTIKIEILSKNETSQVGQKMTTVCLHAYNVQILSIYLTNTVC